MPVTSAPAAVELLWKEGFFKTEKGFSDVQTMLATKGYNFKNNALQNALVRSKFLTFNKAGKVNSYIQKYPAEN
jgi:hypothetical protein